MWWDKPPLFIPDNYAIDVRDLAAASEWYKEKLGLRQELGDRQDDSGRPSVDLHIAKDGAFISLLELQPGASAASGHIIFYATNLEKTREWLTARGVFVEPLRTDSGGHRLFRFQDLDGNNIEVCVEPG